MGRRTLFRGNLDAYEEARRVDCFRICFPINIPLLPFCNDIGDLALRDSMYLFIIQAV